MSAEEIKMLAIIGISLATGMFFGSGIIILLLKDNTNTLNKKIDMLQQKLHNCVKANKY
tara:strand:- start:111 stop:287 length:177 start_codon:yes stop_codon:yes gene_type:complete